MPPSAKPRRGPAARSPAAPSQPAPGYGRVLTCLRVRPALTDEEGGVDSVALQCDASTAKVWALGSAGGEEEAPRQFAFDQLLEQEQGQADLYEAVGAPAVNAALAGGVGCVLCYGAQGAGKWYSMQCERVGQEGLLPRVNSALFAGRDSAMPAPGEVALAERSGAPGEHKPPRVEVAYLMFTREQKLCDLLAGQGATLHTEPSSEPLRSAAWHSADSAAATQRLLARGDANKPRSTEPATAPRACHTVVAYRLTQEDGTCGTLLLATLADADAVISDGLQGGVQSGLQPSLEALGCSLEAMAAGTKGDVNSTHAPLTALLAPALGHSTSADDDGYSFGVARTGGTSFTALLLCAHPHKQRLPQTLHTLGLGQRAGSYGRTRGGVDYLGLASQLIMQRDTKQEGIHELELEVLRKLRPQLEQVMWQEQELAALAAKLQEAEWEARSYADKEAPLQAQAQQVRELHAAQLAALKAERAQISTDLQRAMGALKGSAELSEMRELHEQDTEVIGARLKALQSEVELAEAELATHEETSTKARVLLPGVARDLAALALGLLEQGQSAEAAAIFTHAVATLEGAFGASQPELEAFKQEVKKAVAAAEEEGMLSTRGGSGSRSERGLNC